MFSQWFSQANASGSRSTVLQPLVWLLTVMLGGLMLSFRFAPFWIQAGLAVLVVIVLLFLLGFYAYFALTDKDALRTEKFALSKMAIEHNLLGDNIVGIIQSHDGPAVIESTPRLIAGEEK